MSANSATLAGISLATVAFLTSRSGFEPDRLEGGVGIGPMLFSSTLFFWSMALFFSASVPTKQAKLSIDAFNWAYALGSFGIYLFFSGLLCGISLINLLYVVVGLMSYVVIYVVFVLGKKLRAAQTTR